MTDSTGSGAGSTGWPIDRAVDGGLDRIVTPAGNHDLWLCGRRVVGPDPEAVRRCIGDGTTIVSFNQPRDLARYPDYAPWLTSSPDARWYPIADFRAPDVDDAIPILDEITALLRSKGPVVLHCSAGIGRSGTMAVATLVALGVDLPDAMAQVRAQRPGAGPEVGVQRNFVEALATRLS